MYKIYGFNHYRLIDEMTGEIIAELSVMVSTNGAKVKRHGFTGSVRYKEVSREISGTNRRMRTDILCTDYEHPTNSITLQV